MDLITRFAHSRTAHLFLGMHPMDSLVYGHTHVPGCKKMDCGAYVTNTGHWSGNDQGWYIRISANKFSIFKVRLATGGTHHQK